MMHAPAYPESHDSQTLSFPFVRKFSRCCGLRKRVLFVLRVGSSCAVRAVADLVARVFYGWFSTSPGGREAGSS